MPYAVSPALPSDIPILSTVQWAALLSNPLTQTLYPKGPTPALTTFTRHSYQNAIQFPSVRLIKATDEDSGEIVAFAKWILYPEAKNDLIEIDSDAKGEETNKGWTNEQTPARPEDVDERALEAWNKVITKTRRKVMASRKHTCYKGGDCSLECYFASIAPALWVLDIIHTHPSHQGRGAATSLLKWGLDLADSMRTQCYVESSPIGYHLFCRNDFIDLAEMELDLNRYRKAYGSYKYRHTVMIRMPEKPPVVPPKDGTTAAQLMDKSPLLSSQSGSSGSGRLGTRISGKASLIDIKRSPRLDQQSVSTGSETSPPLMRPSTEVASLNDRPISQLT